MAEIAFLYNGKTTIIQANLNDIFRDICKKFVTKTELDLEGLLFLYNGNQLNLDLQVNQIKINSKKINILVYDNNNTENLSLKFNLKDINNNEYDITIDFSENLDIKAEYKDIFPKKIYKNSFNLEELKNKSKFFKIYDEIREFYNDIKSCLDQKTFFIQAYEKSLNLIIKKQVGIAYDIVFPLKEEAYNLNDIAFELVQRNLNLEKNNNELNCKIMNLEKNYINLENNNNELKLKNINLEKKYNELEEKNIKLEKKINELYEKYELLQKKYNEQFENQNLNKLISNQIEKQNLLSKFQFLFDKNINDIELIYNGFDRKTFLEKCTEKNNLLFLAKDEEGNEFGGYMSSKLLKNTKNELIIKDDNAFIFNLKKKKKFKVIKPENAVNIYDDYLICFGGDCEFGNDLYINLNETGMNTTDCYGDTKYETTNGKSLFSITEFKVYHLKI